MESHGTSFSSLFTFNDFDIDNTVSSLRIGKTTNTEDVRIIKSISVAGPIYIYGGDVYTDSDISISGGGATFEASDILRFGASNTNVVVSTGSNPITLKSDWIAFDGSGNSAGTGYTTFSLSGLLKIEPQSSDFSSEFLGGSDGVTGSELNWKGTVTEISSGVYNFVGDNTSDFKNLTIQDYTRIGGFILNKDNSVTPVRIETHIDANGLITIYGGDIFLEKDLTSTQSGADILVKGRGDIETTASRSVLTNNGDITLWSNSDNSGGGSIVLGDNNVLNSSNGRSGDTDTGGGRITLGGGSGYGTIPTGYSSSSTGAGIKLGTSTSNHTEIYSGGGDISIKGSSTATGQVDDRDESGIYQWGRMTMKSGRGGITMQGTSGEYQGIGFTAPLTESDTGVKQLSMVSSKTSGTAIQLTGSSSAGVGVSFNYLNPKEVLSLGAGQVTINGTGVGAYGIEVQNLDVLSTTGDINMYAGTGGMNVKDRGVRFGSLLGSSVTSSSADLMVQGNELEYDDLVVGFVNTLESTGTAVMESQGSAFSSTFDYKNFDLGSSVSSLRIGKTSNSANVEVYDPVSIAGPISIYGGDVTLREDLSSSLSGADILVKGRGDIETTASRSVLTNNGDITLWSNSDNSGGGSIVLGDNNVLNSSNGRSGDTDTGGGRITLGGGSGYGTIPTGYSSSSTGAGIKLGTSTSNHTEIYSGGGDISIKGSSTATGQVDDRDESGIYQWGRMTMKSGRGGVTMQGTSGEYQGIGFTAPLTESDTGVKQLSMVSSKTSGTAIQLTGSSSAGVGVSFNYLNPKEVLSLGGGQVTINGTGVGTYGIEVQNLDVLSTTGDINMYAGTGGMNVKDRGVRFGSLLGSSVTSSSADLMVQGNELEYDDLVVGFVNTLESTGTAVMESQGSAFSSTFDYKNFDLGSSVSSLRIGKPVTVPMSRFMIRSQLPDRSQFMAGM